MWSAPYIGKTQLAADIWEFRFARPEHYEYIAGQYAQLHFPNLVGDPRGPMRTMSFTSHPSEGVLAFVTRIPTVCSPFKQRLAALAPGDPIVVDAALGDLILPRSTATPLVFVAGGIGIASFTAMLKEASLSGNQRSITLLYALRNADERLFMHQLAHFPFVSYNEFIAPERLTAPTILSAAPEVENTLYYLSGTERFVEGLRHELLATGLSDTQIAFDYFTGDIE